MGTLVRFVQYGLPLYLLGLEFMLEQMLEVKPTGVLGAGLGGAGLGLLGAALPPGREIPQALMDELERRGFRGISRVMSKTEQYAFAATFILFLLGLGCWSAAIAVDTKPLSWEVKGVRLTGAMFGAWNMLWGIIMSEVAAKLR